MATVIRTYLVDDLNGPTENVGTVRFTLDDVSYEIDLDEANQAGLRDNLAKYLICRGHCFPPITRHPLVHP